MKLAIATGVLAQALPTLSRKATNLVHQESHDSLAKTLSSIGKDSDVSSVKDHTRRRAMLENLPFSTVGPLTNPRRRVNKQDTTKYCNPISSDPDVGILSCGPGMFCQRSEDSLLGGQCEQKEGTNMGWNKVVKGQGKGGLLKNLRAESFNAFKPPVECDPASTADIGILSCGDGEHCVASSLSARGGFCMQSSASRQLNALATDVCDPSGFAVTYNCDCSGFDNITGNGDVACTDIENYCFGLFYPGCGDACMSHTFTYSFINFTSPTYEYCLEFKTPSEQRVCIEETLATGTCTVTVDDQPCNSCSKVSQGNRTLTSFDCTNVGGTNGTTAYTAQLVPLLNKCFTPSAGSECTLCTANNTTFNPNSYATPVSVPNLPGNFTCYALLYASYSFATIANAYCPAISATAAGACCTTVCEICGSEAYVPTENYNIPLDISLTGYKSVTCLDLYVAAYENFTITSDICPSAASVARAKCCVPYEANNCDICDGNDLEYPNAVVSIFGYDLPCQSVVTLLNKSACALVQPQVASTCCGTTNSDTTPAPAPSGSDASPPSSSSTLSFAKNIMSIIGVAAVALMVVVK